MNFRAGRHKSDKYFPQTEFLRSGLGDVVGDIARIQRNAVRNSPAELEDLKGFNSFAMSELFRH